TAPGGVGREMARAGCAFFTLCGAAVAGFAFSPCGRGLPISQNGPLSFDSSMARRRNAPEENALPRILPGDLSVVFIFDWSDADRLSFFSDQFTRAEPGSGWNDSFDLPFDRYPGPLQRRLALRSDHARAGHIAWSRARNTDVFSSSVRFGLRYAFTSVGRHDHGLRLY